MNRVQAEELIRKIRNVISVPVMVPCGSYRRGKEEIRDIDIVVVDSSIQDCVAACQKSFKHCKVIRSGEKLATLLIGKDQVEFYGTTLDCMGAALLHSTGSSLFNQSLRSVAKQRDMKLNQYGLWKGEECIESTSEVGILAKLGFGWIPPTDRDGPVDSPVLSMIAPRKINIQVANVLKQIAKKYKKEKNAWKAKSFDTAASIVRNYTIPISKVADLTTISFIGPSISATILEIIETGTSKRLEESNDKSISQNKTRFHRARI
jgi:DNA polymerase (family X)